MTEFRVVVALARRFTFFLPISTAKSSERQLIAGSVHDFVTTLGNKLRTARNV